MIPFDLEIYLEGKDKYRVVTREGDDVEIGAINVSKRIKQGHQIIGWLIVHKFEKEVYAWNTSGKLYGWTGTDYPHDLFLLEL